MGFFKRDDEEPAVAETEAVKQARAAETWRRQEQEWGHARRAIVDAVAQERAAAWRELGVPPEIVIDRLKTRYTEGAYALAAEYFAAVGLGPSDVYGLNIESGDNHIERPGSVAIIYRDSPERAESRRRYWEAHLERTPDEPVAGLLEQERLDERHSDVIPARNAELRKRIDDIL